MGMSNYRITQAKPNPRGRDRFGSLTPTSQIAGEWIDILNISSQEQNLEGIVLQHIAYPTPHSYGVWGTAIRFPSIVLGVSESLRVHSGQRIDISLLHPEDISGANWHIFTNVNAYMWNNDRGDTARLVLPLNNAEDLVVLDQAEYINPPSEGVILERVGQLLV